MIRDKPYFVAATPVSLSDFIESKEKRGYKITHTATQAGYISRKVAAVINRYHGRFGNGFIIHRPRFDNSGFHDVLYLIDETQTTNHTQKG